MELYELSATDFGPYEKFVLPLYKSGLVWIGGINKDTAAADSNGSGKSTLFKALTWGLYGESIDGEKGDKVIRNGAKKATVKVVLIDEKGEKWEVIRQRSKGSPRTVLIKPDGNAFEGDKAETQERITRMVGLDFKAFKNTVLYGQNDSARFAHPNTKDADRKLMLHRILNTGLLTACHAKAKELAKELRADNRELENQLEATRVALEEHDISGLDESRREYECERDSKVDKRKQLAIGFRDRAKALMKQAAEGDVELPDVAPINKAIKKKHEEIKIAEAANEEAKVLSDNFKALSTEHMKASAVKDDWIRKRDEAGRQLRRLEGDECPTCTAPLGEGAALEHIEELKREERAAKKKLKSAEATTKKKKDACDEMQKQHSEVGKRARMLPTLFRELSRLNTKLSDAKLEISEAENRASELKIAAKGLAEQAKSELALVRETSEAENPYEAQLEKAKARVEVCNAKIEKLENAMAKKSKQLSYYEFWVKGFSNQGLPSYILDSVMPYVTERANHYLETLSDGDITMEFSTQRELKSAKGEVRDEIDIRWDIERTEMYPPSGGQLKKMEVATDLALMDLVSTNEGGSLDLMLLDEVLDGLDAEGCSRVLLLLQKLRAVRGTIFVVSHESRMAEVFEKGIFAVKDGGVASLEFSR